MGSMRNRHWTIGPTFPLMVEYLPSGSESRMLYDPEDVYEILRNLKAMVFPTYLEQEGYSGIIIESYSVGLPVLCSGWKFLPEIVDERSGILFEPKSSDAIM